MVQTLDLDQAYVTVQFYGEHNGIKNLWESLDHMRNNYSELDGQEREALKLLSGDIYVGLVNHIEKDLKITDEDDGYAD
jgi:hypothetical protein